MMTSGIRTTTGGDHANDHPPVHAKVHLFPFIIPSACSYTPTHERAASFQLNLRTSNEPCWRSVLASGGWRRTAMILLAISLMSQKSTFKAWVRTSLTPDCLEMITGTSWLIASNGAIPKGSLTEGMT